jgi:preprotein translocase subunit Sss1
MEQLERSLKMCRGATTEEYSAIAQSMISLAD